MTITRNFSVLANGAGSANTLSLGGATLGSNALAVTGTIAGSGNLTLTNTTAVGFTAAATANSISPYLVLASNNRTWWTAAVDTGADASFKIGTGATIGSNTCLTIAPTTQLVTVAAGLTVTGTLTAVGRITQSLSPVAAEYALRSTGQTTGWIAIDMANTGGDYIIAGENSTGNNIIAGDSAYDMCVRGPSGISFSANAGATQHMRLSSAGGLTVANTVTAPTVYSSSGVTAVTSGTTGTITSLSAAIGTYFITASFNFGVTGYSAASIVCVNGSSGQQVGSFGSTTVGVALSMSTLNVQISLPAVGGTQNCSWNILRIA